MMAPKYLIVNADDFGTDRERSKGILQAGQSGIVTTTSIMANLIGDPESLHPVQETFGNRIGVHLNLTFGAPLTKNVRTLTREDGLFFSKPVAWRKALGRQLDLTEVKKELSSQVQQLLTCGISPDHLDGNNHIHVFPGINAVVAGIAEEFGIRRIRVPFESFRHWADLFRPHGLKKLLMGCLCQLTRPVFRQHGIVFTDHFAGIQFPVVASVHSLQTFLEKLPSGTTELMCHPGYANLQANPFSNVEREQELFSLTHPVIRETLQRYRIILTSYSELEP